MAAPQFASLYVGDLNQDVTEAMLYEIFNSVGPVGSIRVCRDNLTKKSLGYAYINFSNVADAERALDTLNYSSIKGRSCRIMWSQRDPSLRKSGAGNVYVKNLDKNIDNKALYDTFSLFGNILSCKVAADITGKSHGYGFVHYETEEAAKQAIQRVNGMQIGENTVEVSEFVDKKARAPNDVSNFTNIYVKCFPSSWDEAKLKEVFGEHGEITSMALRSDPKGRPFAFINFENSEAAKSCVDAMHKKDFSTDEEKHEREGKEDDVDESGHPTYLLYCQRAQTKQERLRENSTRFGNADKGDRQAGVNLFVKNVDDSTDEEGLRALFEPFGTITSVSAPKDDKGNSKGFGFVCFESSGEATKAVTEMHLKVVNGKPLYVGLAEKREARSAASRAGRRHDIVRACCERIQGGKGAPGGVG